MSPAKKKALSKATKRVAKVEPTAKAKPAARAKAPRPASTAAPRAEAAAAPAGPRIVTAGSVTVRAGTSGYSFDEWRGNFYPDKITPAELLGFYAARFPTVEINNTFYRLPKESVLQAWAAQVPADFTFVLKASQRITHFARLKDCGELLGYLYRVSTALGGKLGPILFQLPPNMKKDLPRLADFLAARPDRRRIAIEFRHATWFDDEVFALLKAEGAALCVADTGEEPAAPLVATSDWGYLRLRREQFSDAELADWVRRIAGQPWTDAFVFLKHEEEGLGPKLAARLMELCRP